MAVTKSRQVVGAKPRRNRGFSLVELLISITLGLLLIAGLIQLFASSKVTFNTTEAAARIQENGRFSLEVLKRELREAGTHGFCAAKLDIINHLDTTCGSVGKDLYDPDRPLVGWEYGGTGPGDSFTLPVNLDPAATAIAPSDWLSSADSGTDLPVLLQNRVLPGSDVLMLRRLEPIPGVTGALVNDPSSNTISLNTAPGPAADGALLLVTNCATGVDLFQNVAAPAATAFQSGGSCFNDVDWSTAYDESMQAFRVVTLAYYVGENSRGEPSLFRLDMTQGVDNANNPQFEELVEGVDNMQVLYGFSQAAPAGDGQSVNNWLAASDLPDDGWEQVIAVRVALSLSSPDRADADTTDVTFDLAGTDITLRGDGRLRQPFSTTVALRNRLLVE